MKTLLYVGHAYHNKTGSVAFLKEMLKAKYQITFHDFDPYNDDLKTCFNSFNGKKYDILLLFQVMPNLRKIKKYVNFDRCVFFPMYDGVPDRTNPIWEEYINTQIICFSSTLNKELCKIGFASKYIKFFPAPIKFNEWGNEGSVFFWNRVTHLNTEKLEEIIDVDELEHIHIHKDIDPTHEFVEPAFYLKDKITYSEWFKTKDEMLSHIYKSALYIAPREYEGIGMSFLEAMAAGRCVIAPNNPTMNEYIKHEKTGLLYDYNNPKKLDLSNIRQIQKNAFEFMQDGFKKWNSTKNDLLEWIDEKPKNNSKKIKKYFSTLGVTKFHLFGILPLITIKSIENKTRYYLFGFIKLMKITYYK